MSQLQTIKTMIHEMAHEKLHAKDNLDTDHPVDRRTKEVEALCSFFHNAYVFLNSLKIHPFLVDL
jgi:hypothetical protein